jgi:phytoene dehydrogenase-like protein
VCAAYLAKAGLDVVLLEARSTVGGCASTVAVDALGGARVNVCNCDHTLFVAMPIREELELARFGLRYLEIDPVQLSLGWDGWTPWFQFRDVDRTLEGLRLTHPEETDGYRRYLRAARPLAELVLEMSTAVPTLPNVARRVLDRRGRGVATLLRWSRRSVAQVVRSFFQTDALRTPVIATGPAVWGRSPHSPRTGLGALGYAMKHTTGVWRPEGGSGRLPESLAAAIESSGGVIRTGARVAEILAEGGRVRGVRLESGEEVACGVVVAAADPRTAFVRWVARPPASARELTRRWRARPELDGYESKLDAVVTSLPRYPNLDGVEARLRVIDPLIPTAIVSPGLDAITAAHVLMGQGRVAERPIFYANIPSVRDESMRAGSGHVFSLEALYTPYALEGGWSRSGEPRRWLESFSTIVDHGFIETVGGWRAVTPPDYERDFGLERGHAPSFPGGPIAALLGHDRELSRYETPIRGLYLTGAGTFPGAGVWGASGRNAAHVVLAHAERPTWAKGVTR